MPHGATVWAALIVTGLFATAFAYLAQTWAQRRTTATRTALAFALEPVWAAFFGMTLRGDSLGAAGWVGCARDHGGDRRGGAGVGSTELIKERRRRLRRCRERS